MPSPSGPPVGPPGVAAETLTTDALRTMAATEMATTLSVPSLPSRLVRSRRAAWRTARRAVRGCEIRGRSGGSDTAPDLSSHGQTVGLEV